MGSLCYKLKISVLVSSTSNSLSSANLKEEFDNLSVTENNKVGEQRLHQSKGLCLSDMSEGHKGICKVFASGKTCRFGKQCRYLHFRHPSLVSDSERRYNNGAVNNQRSASSSHSFKYQSSENFQEEKENEAVNTAAAFPLSSSHPGVDQEYVPLRYDKKQPSQNDPGKTSDKNVCRFYLRTGTCRFGKNCRFLHERHEEVSKDFAEAVHPSERDPCQIQPPDIIHSEAVGPSEIPSGPSKEEEGPCRVETCKFHLQGKCKFGDRCTKSHVIKDGTHEAANDNKEPRKFDNRRPTNRFGQDLTIDVSNATEDQKRQLRGKAYNIAYKLQLTICILSEGILLNKFCNTLTVAV